MKNLITRFRTRKGEAGMHQLYAISFSVIAVVALVTLILVNSRADDTGQATNIANVAPSVGSLVTATSSNGSDISSLSLTEATTKAIYVRGTATDTNGYGDIDAANQYTMKTYHSNASCTDTENGANCYINTSGTGVTLSNCSSGTTCAFEITKAIQYYADATDAVGDNTNWIAAVTVTDDSSDTGSNSDTFEVATLTALTVTASVDYGTLALYAYSAEKTLIVANSGNEIIDYTVTAPDMTCSLQGTIPTGNTRYNYSAAVTQNNYANATLMTTSAVAVDDSVAIASDGNTPSNSNFYTLLRIPENGVKGSCTNTVAFTATTNGP